MPDNSATLILLPFLAAFIERIVEIVSPVFESLSTEVKRVVGLALAGLLAAAIVALLDLDLISSLVPDLSDFQGKALTAIALAGGSAPVHELIRLAEEVKKNQKRDATDENPTPPGPN